MKRRLHSILVFCLLLVGAAHAQTILNAYARANSIAGVTVTVDNLNEVNAAFTVGQKVILMQMQDDVIGPYTLDDPTFGILSSIQSAGLYEVRTLVGRAGLTFTLDQAPINAFNLGPNATVQLISFPNLGTNYTTTNAITGVAWNGFVGGVVAFEVTDTLTLAHNVSANGLGFRGGAANNDNLFIACTPGVYRILGTNPNYALKGEGIYKISNTNYEAARGKILNGGGGGNSCNAGGGGGGNWTTGGDGGMGYPSCNPPVGGQGGLSLSSNIHASRVYLGGGGGAGEGNQNVNTSGGNGGGIVLIKAFKIKTSPICSPVTISADGINGFAHNSNDGAGGGGAGGSIVLQVSAWAPTAACPITVTANGGNGANVGHPSNHGGGGGGAQGCIIFSIPIPVLNTVSQTLNGSPGCNNNVGPGCNSSAGSPSGTNNTGIIGAQNSVLTNGSLHFAAEVAGEQVALRWEAEEDGRTKQYVVDRSMDQSRWSAVLEQETQLGSTAIVLYEGFDPDPPTGLLYYRLRQMDLDGNVRQHEIATVWVAGMEQPDFQVFPNPGDGLFQLRLEGSASGGLHAVEIYSALGQLAHKGWVRAGETTSIDLRGKGAGIYFVHVVGCNRIRTMVLIEE